MLTKIAYISGGLYQINESETPLDEQSLSALLQDNTKMSDIAVMNKLDEIKAKGSEEMELTTNSQEISSALVVDSTNPMIRESCKSSTPPFPAVGWLVKDDPAVSLVKIFAVLVEVDPEEDCAYGHWCDTESDAIEEYNDLERTHMPHGTTDIMVKCELSKITPIRYIGPLVFNSDKR
jgi:hypothetical protein